MTEIMQMLRDVPANTVLAIAVFAAAAALIAIAMAVTGTQNTDRLVVRLVIELPLLVIAAGIGLTVINLISAAASSSIGGAKLVAALIAGGCAWVIASGQPSFAGLGYHPLIRPAYALAAALPWLVGANLFGTRS